MAQSNRPKRGTRKSPEHAISAIRLPVALVTRIDAWAGVHNARTRIEAISRLLEIGLTANVARAPAKGQRARAVTLATEQIDQMGDNSATTEQRATRKQRLTEGPSAFRNVRRDRPKQKDGD